MSDIYAPYRRQDTNCWELAEYATRHARTVLFYGTHGTGKTRMLYDAATVRLNGKKPEMTTLDADSSRFDLTAYQTPPDFRWVQGYGLRAWAGSILIVNELDRIGEGSAETAFHYILDDAAVAQVVTPDGKVFRPHAGFACFASMNGVPADLPPALLDRFEARVLIDRPHPGLIASIANETLRKMAEGHFSDTNPANWIGTPRDFLAIDRLLTTGADITKASALVLLNAEAPTRMADMWAINS